MIRLSFYGAAGQVTGSMHLLEAAGGRFLLDAGLFQGRRSETHELNLRLPFDPRRMDGIVLSHAHIDHSGRLPLLVRHGFHGPIHATPATRDLCAVMLPDSAHIQEKDFEFLQRRGKAGAAERAALLHGRRGGDSGADGGDAVPPDHPPPEAPRPRVRRCRPHPRLGHRRYPDHRGRQPPAGVLGRHRPERSPDHPRPRAALRPDRHPHRRGDLRRPEPRVGRGGRGEAGRGGAAGGGARRQGPGAGVRPRPVPGADLQPPPALARREDPRDPDLRRQPARGGHHHRLPDASRGVRPAGAADRRREQGVRLPAGALRPRGGGQQGDQLLHRAGGRHRGLGDGGVGPDPAPPRPWPAATTATWCSSSASRRSTPSAAGSRKAPARCGSSARSTRSRPRSRPSAATRPTPTGASWPPGSAGSAVRSAGRSWSTASRARSRRWPGFSGRPGCATSGYPSTAKPSSSTCRAASRCARRWA